MKRHAPPLPAEPTLSFSNHSSDGAGGSESVTSTHNDSEETGGALADNFFVLFCVDDNTLWKLFPHAVEKVRPSWTISEAASGEAALQLVETNKFDVIIIDQYMANTEKLMLGSEIFLAVRAVDVKSTIYGLSANNIWKNHF